MKRIRMGLLALAGLGVSVAAQGQMTLPGKFEVTDTGSASYTIPISIVPGAAGLEPKLSLQYDSRSGNGLLGVGWSLAGLPAITRCGRTIAQDGAMSGVAFDANDRFCLDGQRLIATTGTYGADQTEYRTERESFSKVVSYGTAGSGPSWFKVWTKAGLVMEFGNTTDSKVEAQGKASVRVWAINKTSDTKGNYFTVSYTEGNANGEYRPDRIDYTGNSSTAPANSVRFVYETRPDIVPMYQAGSIIKTTKRLTKVQAWQSENLVREYQLAYPPGSSDAVLFVDACGMGGNCEMRISFGYDPSNIEFGITALLQGNGLYLGWQPHFTDINGDGRTDIFWDNQSTGARYIWISRGDATFDITALLQGNGAYLGWQPYFTDINGDGRADIFWNNSTTGVRYIWMSRGDATFDITALSQGNGLYLGWQPHFTDINGDGRTDIFWDNQSTGARYIWMSRGDATFDITALLQGNGLYLGWQPHFTDINGDGRADIFWNNSTTGVRYIWMSRGDATFDITALSQGNGLYLGWQPHFTDINGDGRTDIFWDNQSTGARYIWRKSGAGRELATATSGTGGATQIFYAALATGGLTYSRDTGASACSYPCVDVQGPLYVVSEVKSSNGLGISGAGSEYRSTYRYAGARADQHGRGFLGFRQMTVKDEQTGVEQVTTYRQDYPFTGLVASREKKLSSQLLNRSSNTYSSTNLGGTRRYPFLTQSLEESWELTGAALPAVTMTYQYDAWGNATQVGVSTGDGHAKTTVNAYSNDAPNWLLGRLTRSEVTSTTPGN
jgi:hypothetical protein